MAKILIASREEAVDILTNPKYNKDVSAIVSISSQNQSAPQPVKKCQDKKDKIVLVLHFDDMEKIMIGNPRCKGWEPPQKKHIMSILEHSKNMLNSGGIILCHCQAGISRSAAAAFILKCMELGPGNEQEALVEILKTKNSIGPNALMVELADEILGDKWDLMGALENINNLRKKLNYATDATPETLSNMLKKHPDVPIIGKGSIVRI